jgi:adenosylcobinamide-GDP ribazoletransferase
LKFFAALKFLTILPVFRKRADSLEDIGGSVVYYPVVGLLIGLAVAGLWWLFRQALPPAAANALVIVSLVVITGALHLDGFIDTCDGIAGHKPPEARWQVMHDSRSGAFGVVGAVLVLLLQYAAFNSFATPVIAVALMTVLGRWAMVFAIFAYPYARPEGLGKAIKQYATWQRFAFASAITLLLSILLARLSGFGYLAGPAIMLGVWVIIMLAAAFFEKMFAGLTGDTYGAINEIAEVSALLMIAALWSHGWLI